MGPLDIWIPEQTPADARASLPGGITVHELLQHGELPERLGHADMLITGFFPARAVEAIPRFDGLRVVRSGLKPSDVVVVNGLQRVRPGAHIDPVKVAM